MRRHFKWMACLGFLFCGCSAFSQLMNSAPPFRYQDVPVRIETPYSPQPVTGSDGNTYMTYQIFITNLAVMPVTIDGIEVSSREGGRLLAFNTEDLEDYNRFRSVLGVMAAGQPPRRINPAATMVAFVWLRVNAGGRVPDTLFQDFRFKKEANISIMSGSPAAPDTDMVISGVPVPVIKKEPVEIGLPFRKGNWRCGNAPGTYVSDHQVLVVRQGRLRNPQEWGFDFSEVDSAGNILPSPFPDTISRNMFYGYGESILAVADGRIVFVQDGVPENIPQANGSIRHATELNRKTYAGNWICLEIKEGIYAFYAHLQPGKIKVQKGQKVKKGQVIAFLGNSGNTPGPHLHFHLGDQFNEHGGDLNGNQGLPFVFDRFRIKNDRRVHARQIPLTNQVISVE